MTVKYRLPTPVVILARFAAGVLLAVATHAAADNSSLPGFREESTTFTAETKTRRALVQVALEREPADLLIEDVTLLNVFTGNWETHQDIVISGSRIAWVGDTGAWGGKAKTKRSAKGLWAVPGFGESHKHIESSYLTPDHVRDFVRALDGPGAAEGHDQLRFVFRGQVAALDMLVRLAESRNGPESFCVAHCLRFAAPRAGVADPGDAAATDHDVLMRIPVSGKDIEQCHVLNQEVGGLSPEGYLDQGAAGVGFRGELGGLFAKAGQR